GCQGGAGAPEPCFAQAVQPGPELIVGLDEEGLDLVGSLGPGLDRAAPGEDQQPQLTDQAAAVLGDRGRLACQHCPGGVLGVDRVAFALAATAGPVRAVDLPDLHAA